jgi:hypothetical protein
VGAGRGDSRRMRSAPSLILRIVILISYFRAKLPKNQMGREPSPSRRGGFGGRELPAADRCRWRCGQAEKERDGVPIPFFAAFGRSRSKGDCLRPARYASARNSSRRSVGGAYRYSRPRNAVFHSLKAHHSHEGCHGCATRSSCLHGGQCCFTSRHNFATFQVLLAHNPPNRIAVQRMRTTTDRSNGGKVASAPVMVSCGP